MATMLALFIFLQFADAYTTWRVLGQGGHEANPLLAAMFEEFGVLQTLVIVKSAAIIAVAILLHDQPWIIAGLNVLYVAVVANNLNNMKKKG